MKISHPYLVVIWCLTMNLPAMGQKQGIPADGMQFDTTVFDFGNIPLHSTAEHTFYFHNKGDAPLTIINVRSTCGCTATKWTKEPVLPGMKGYVTIKYNTTIPGSFSKSVSIIRNNHGRTILLTIKGNVKNDETD